MNIEVVLDESDEKQYHVTSDSRPEKYHLVSLVEGLWRCTCESYNFHKEKNLGSFLCKHIKACILEYPEVLK